MTKSILFFTSVLSTIFTPVANINQPASGQQTNHVPLSVVTETNIFNPTETIKKLQSKNLPIASVEIQGKDDAEKTAVIIPQYHITPGSTASDPQNEQAYQVQQEIYAILQELIPDTQIDTILVEGKEQGIVISGSNLPSPDELKEIAKQLLTEINDSNALSLKEKDEASRLINNMYAQKKRELYLQGAPYLLLAQGKIQTLYGAENPETLKDSADIVRDHLYLQDRLAQLQNHNAQSFQLMHAGIDIEQLYKLLNNKQRLSPTLEIKDIQLKADRANDTGLVQLLQDFKKMIDTTAISESQFSTQTDLPSRSDNPYNNINDISQLQNLLQDNEKQINQTILNKRNHETADAFVNMLEQAHRNEGIIQFGAAHTQGLTQALLDQGVRVIIVQPQSVVNE